MAALILLGMTIREREEGNSLAAIEGDKVVKEIIGIGSIPASPSPSVPPAGKAGIR